MKKKIVVILVPMIAVVAGAFLLALIFNTPPSGQVPASVAATTTQQ